MQRWTIKHIILNGVAQERFSGIAPATVRIYRFACDTFYGVAHETCGGLLP